jgi:alpha-amylase/alpha-mannosidase (GH57 family)
MHRYVCIHGHFYQPPRENPWLEAIELQDSAYPYHDWNERITAECYAPNAKSRILDGAGNITRIVNNYARVSFNVGPTLLAWLAAHAPDTYAAILDADRQSRARFSGHGSALAQVYNHAIMPLANRRDKLIQIRWGKADFERRFGRPPEGMWLAETAVDLETLDFLAREGVLFTVLSPHQARRVRPWRVGARQRPEAADWQDVTGGRIDPTRAYLCRLPAGRSIALFFYDGPVSQAVAFEGLLHSGEKFAGRLLGAFSDKRDWPQLVHIATDGETYGHHAAHGDMALAYALELIEARGDVRLTNYGEFLARHPPTWEVEVIENSAWSCAHGVGRWREDCGCRTGGRPGWTQQWRGPLRTALDWLRDELAGRYEELGAAFFRDPWAARDGYVEVLLGRGAGGPPHPRPLSPEVGERGEKSAPARPNGPPTPPLRGRGDGGEGVGASALPAPPDPTADFLARHGRGRLTDAETVTALKLLELQRNCLLMYTSCGWFFDDLSGIETVQVLQYAGRAVQLAEDLFGEPFEAAFLDRLAAARSNVPAHRDGRRVYEKFVRPARVDLAKVAAHYAVSALFHDDPRETQLYCYAATADEFRRAALGKARLVTGTVRITSAVTRESAAYEFAAAHFGEVHLHGGVRPLDPDAAAAARRRDGVAAAFERFDVPGFVRLVDREYAAAHSLRSLFRDEQRATLEQVTAAATQELEQLFRQAYEAHTPVMRFLQGLDRPPLPAFQTVAEFLLNLDLRRACAAAEPDLDLARQLLREAQGYGVSLDAAGLGYALRRTAARLLDRLAADPDDAEALRLADGALELAQGLSFPVDFWEAQNTYYGLRETVYADRRRRAAAGDAAARDWVGAFAALGRKLNVCVPDDPG